MNKNDVDAHVGKRLRLRRTMMGLSQEALAKAVGITFQQVQKYEKGANAMNAGRLFEFASYMQVPISYFFDGIEQSAKNHHMQGFAEDSAIFEGAPSVSDRESLEMMKAFKRIKEQSVRKRMADLVRAVAEQRALIEE